MPDMVYIPGEPARERPATQQPFQPPQYAAWTPPRKKRTGLLIAGIAAAFVVAFALMALLLTLTGVAPWSAKQQAIHACQDSVTAQLRSPSTAKYSGVSASRTPIGGGWDVTGDVDAQNAFGAIIRNAWSCHVSWENGQAVTRTSIES